MSEVSIVIGLVLMIAVSLGFIRYVIYIETRDKRGPYRHMNSVNSVRHQSREAR